MNASAEGYDQVDPIESYSDLDFTDEALGLRPRGVFVPGGLSSATLHTPKGPARLNLPAPVPTLAQFRALEQRVNATNAELVRLRRELAIRRREPQGMGFAGVLFAMMGQRKLREDLQGHTHTVAGPAVLPTTSSSSSKFSSLLPFLLLQPGIFGGSPGSGSQPIGGAEAMSPLLLMFLLPEILD